MSNLTGGLHVVVFLHPVAMCKINCLDCDIIIILLIIIIIIKNRCITLGVAQVQVCNNQKVLS